MREKIRNKNINKDKNISLDCINDIEKNKGEFKYKNIKKIFRRSNKSDIINFTKRSSQAEIDWNELSRDEFENNINKDDIEFGLTKSQEMKFEVKPKRSRTISKNDKDLENEEDFYFMKIIQRKKNNDMKKKLFDNSKSQLEKNISQNYVEEDKKGNNDINEKVNNENEKREDNDYENEDKNLQNSFGKKNLVNDEEENKERIKPFKDNQNNNLYNNELNSYNLDNIDNKEDQKYGNEPEKDLINISLEEKELEWKKEEENEEEERKKEIEIQREKEIQKQKEKQEEFQREIEEKKRQEKEKQDRERLEKERQEKEKQEKERLEKERIQKENKEKERKEKLEKEKQEKIEKEKEKNNLKNNQNYIRNPNQNKYDAPKKLPMNDPYQTSSELPAPPKVQAPRQVLEFERLKGRSRLPEIQRAYSFNRKKFGFGNLDVVEPGELVSNIKLRLINQMLVRRQSDFGFNSKSINKNKSVKSLNHASSFTNKKYDSDNEEKRKKKISFQKKLTNIIKNINDKKMKSKINSFFKKWKTPSKYIRNMPIMKRISIMDCAPPPRQEKKSSAMSVVFLSKSLGKDVKPFFLENEKKNENNKKLINIERVNIEKRDNKSPDIYKKDFKPQRVQSGGRIEFVLPTQRQIVNNDKTENIKKEDKIKKQNEEGKEEEEELEEEYEMQDKKYKNNKVKNIFKFDSNSSESPKNEIQISNKNSLIKSKENFVNIKDKKIKEIDINDGFNNKEIDEEENNLINESKKKYLLLSSEIFKINKLGNRAKNNVNNLLRNMPQPLFENLNPEIFINLHKKFFQNCAAYHIYSLYFLFNTNHQFYHKRAIFDKWRKLINKDSNMYSNKRKFNYYNCESSDHCRGCVCFKQNDAQSIIKKVLIKYILMKEYEPLRYYLYLWNKKTFMEKNIE